MDKYINSSLPPLYSQALADSPTPICVCVLVGEMGREIEFK